MMVKNTSKKYPVPIPVSGTTNLAPARADFTRSESTSPSPKGVLFVTIFAGALFATFVSPQINLLGRGERSSLPLFFLLLGVVGLLTPRDVWQKLRIYFFPTFLGFAFVIYGIIQNFLEPYPTRMAGQVLSMAICLMLWIAVILLRNLFPVSLESVRWIVLVVFCVSLGVGIPLLIGHPGIARLTAGNPTPGLSDTTLYLKGIANYAWYTPAAIAWPVIANWLNNKPRKRLAKIIGWSLLLTSSAAVFFSTLTMALVLLCLGILLWLFLVLFSDGSRAYRLIAVGVIFALFVALPRLNNLALSSDVTMFSTAKATRLFERTLTSGFVAGDETGRAKMLVMEMETFYKNPIFGAWGFDTSAYFIGGHSSWGDTLAMQGVFGLSLWLGFLSPSWRRRKQPLSVSAGIAGGTISWILLALGGILNPTFNSQVGLLLIWLFDEGGVWQTQKAETLAEKNPRKSFVDRK